MVCSALQDNNGLLIDPDGRIYKCWGLIGKEQFVVGELDKEEFKPIYYKFVGRNPLHYEKCRNCDILPFCGGGCFHEAYYRTGDPFNPICGFTFSKEVLEMVLKLYAIDRYKKILEEKSIFI